jgi:hypothetical protein
MVVVNTGAAHKRVTPDSRSWRQIAVGSTLSMHSESRPRGHPKETSHCSDRQRPRQTEPLSAHVGAIARAQNTRRDGDTTPWDDRSPLV